MRLFLQDSLNWHLWQDLKVSVIAAYQHQEPGEYTISVYINFDFYTLHTKLSF